MTNTSTQNNFRHKVKSFFPNICECGDFMQLSKKESIKKYNHKSLIIKFYRISNLFVPWVLFFTFIIFYETSSNTCAVDRNKDADVENELEDTGRGKGKLGQSERVAWTYIHYQM